ncbi:MAG: ATP-dependent Clp protease ATP-binding subunit [Clostridiales bacterium]|jgi:ATP-dependent Clp protease ATP-binding subunit ClpC|nr:ATP-dependent Clp protease ATP-binding subunit [Clostridiales bacterium]
MQFPCSVNLKKALDEAKEAAVKYANPGIGTEHILYGLIKVEAGAAGRILREYGADLSFAEQVFGQGEHVRLMGGIEYTQRVQAMFQNSYMLAAQLDETIVSTEHFLYCLLIDQTSVACAILRKMFDINTAEMAMRLKNEWTGAGGGAGSGGGARKSGGAQKNGPQLPGQLNDIGVDITKKAREHKIDPIIGRKDEIERIIQILCRKTKNNPVLIGEPGVGKSAVVEGLAKAIVAGNVPELLKDKIVFSMDIGSLVAGTKYRGALEEKLKSAIDIIREQGNIIVFIDEIHSLAQAGSKEGEVSPADILKPYLARGEMQTIGATTTDEYRKFIEKDKALERRFQPIMVEPPGVEETIEILKGLRENYESFHKIKITDEAIEAAAKLSDRYISDRFQPDKAIDLIDEAMSRAKVNGNILPPEQKERKARLEEVVQTIAAALAKEDYKTASELKKERDELKKTIDEESLEWHKHNEHAISAIGEAQIAEIVAKWTKIPVSRLSESESQRLIHLEELLHERVIGQDAAVTSVSKAIRRARAGLKNPGRPIGSFLFLGPTGVGKTELTKALSEAMFDDENAVIRLDMSEYMESHSVSKLIGAPPGYVGFDDGGQLTEQVRRRPYSVVLFDEIEKAHPDVYNVLLQMLDDGRLTDAQGRTVSFKNTLLIMTSNVGVSELKNTPRSLGFSAQEQAEADDKKTEDVLQGALRRHFKPEFLNRIDVICYFHTLKKEDIRQIAGIMVKRFERTLAERSIQLEISPAAMELLVEKGYDVEYGARPLRRVIEQNVEDQIAEGIIEGRIRDHSTVKVDAEADKIVIR